MIATRTLLLKIYLLECDSYRGDGSCDPISKGSIPGTMAIRAVTFLADQRDTLVGAAAPFPTDGDHMMPANRPVADGANIPIRKAGIHEAGFIFRILVTNETTIH